ncbi:MAG TPA: hypothetical protein VN886_14725 [Acidimicrobiales bacterium]|nr:hypothetical protein [Acidimicrobiales bacterium]
MADAPPQGLLPQLTEVLYALTEAQEMLLNKLQNVPIEHRRFVPQETAPPSRVGPANWHDQRLAAVRSTIEPSTSPDHANRPMAMEQSLATTRTTQSTIAGLRTIPGFASDNATPPEAAPMPLDVSGRTDVPTEVIGIRDIDDMTKGGPPTHSTETNALQADPAATASANAYNFFDELDARLANRETPGDSGKP